MAQESCPTESLKGIFCWEMMTLCIFPERRLTAGTVFRAEGGAHPRFRHSLQFGYNFGRGRTAWSGCVPASTFIFSFTSLSFPGYWQVLIMVEEEAAVPRAFSETLQPKDNKWGISAWWKSWKNQGTNLNTSVYHLMWLISSEVSVFCLHFDCRYRL